MYALEESVTYFRRAGFSWIELCNIERRARTWSNFCTGFELLVPETGRATVSYRRREYGVHPGQMFCAGPGEAYSVSEITEPAKLRVLAIDPGFVLECLARHAPARELELRTVGPVPRVAVTSLTHLYRVLEATEASTEHLASAVNATLAAVTERICSCGEQACGQRRADAFVRIDTFRVPHSSFASEAARLQPQPARAGLSRFQALRQFKKRYGLPPHTYALCVRIALAKRSLRAGHSLSAVAAAQAFTDQSHFTRHFKRLVGVTPRAYAQLGSSQPIAAPRADPRGDGVRG